MVKKSAFTLIELVFAIVIMAIAVLSLPVMNQALSKGTDSALVQEAIFAAAAELNQATTYRWDEKSSDNGTTYAKVLPTNATDCTNHLRPGHIPNQKKHRECANIGVAPSTTLGLDPDDNNTADDIDDLNGMTSSMYSGDATTTSGYKKDLNIKTTVSYAAFGTITAGDHNMKKITVTVSNNDGDKIAELSTYSANIGGAESYSKRYD